MKKILFLLVALVCSMSMNAQVIRIKKGNAIKAVYTQEEVDKVVFETVSTIGTAKATIDGNEVDVDWVQLWIGGPKFATHNVGAVDITGRGDGMKFADAAKTGSDYVWGPNWCTPSKEDMEHLAAAASGQDDEKVSCEYIQKDGVYGFNFTGKDEGCKNCSVFFPTLQNDDDEYYWTRTPYDIASSWCLSLKYRNILLEFSTLYKCRVRPVLKD